MSTHDVVSVETPTPKTHPVDWPSLAWWFVLGHPVLGMAWWFVTPYPTVA
jgi:hypothetical protein